MRPLSSSSTRRRDRKSGLPAVPVFIAVLVICGLFYTIHKGAETRDSGGTPTSPLRQYLLTPASEGVVSIHNWFSRNIASITRAPKLARSNQKLEAQVALLTEQNREMSQEADENKRLRALLSFKTRSPLNLLPAEVISTKPTQARDTITLSRGAKDHVSRLMAVITSDGSLIGQVVSETYDSCDVLLLTDDQSSVGAMIYPIQPPDKLSEGICRGEHVSPLLNFIYLPSDADMVAGQEVFTSGMGGVYPKGLVIGTIRSFASVPADASKIATVQPAVNFDHLQDVFIIMQAPVLPPETSAPLVGASGR